MLWYSTISQLIITIWKQENSNNLISTTIYFQFLFYSKRKENFLSTRVCDNSIDYQHFHWTRVIEKRKRKAEKRKKKRFDKLISFSIFLDLVIVVVCWISCDIYFIFHSHQCCWYLFLFLLKLMYEIVVLSTLISSFLKMSYEIMNHT